MDPGNMETVFIVHHINAKRRVCGDGTGMEREIGYL